MTPLALGCAFGMLAALLVAPLARCLRPIARPASPRVATAPHSLRALPDYASLLDAVARQVRSGSSLTSALVDEIDRSGPLGGVLVRLSDGGSLSTALKRVVPRNADLALTVQALSATAHLGGPIAATLDEAAGVLRERTAARAERRAHGSQARLSARILTVVPLLFAAWSAIASERTREIYLSSAGGGICAVCGLLLNAAGWQWMRRTIGPT